MRLLSIDHGTRSGYSVFVDGKYFKSGVIELEDIKNLYDAYKKYYEVFAVHRPTHVVVEKVNVAGTKFGGQNIVKLAQLQAIIVLIAQGFNAEILEANPMSMKKHVTGDGRAEKLEVAMHIASRWQLNYKDICVPEYFKRKEGIKTYHADESDSIALGTYALDCLV